MDELLETDAEDPLSESDYEDPEGWERVANAGIQKAMQKSSVEVRKRKRVQAEQDARQENLQQNAGS